MKFFQWLIHLSYPKLFLTAMVDLALFCFLHGVWQRAFGWFSIVLWGGALIFLFVDLFKPEPKQ